MRTVLEHDDFCNVDIGRKIPSIQYQKQQELSKNVGSTLACTHKRKVNTHTQSCNLNSQGEIRVNHTLAKNVVGMGGNHRATITKWLVTKQTVIIKNN